MVALWIKTPLCEMMRCSIAAYEVKKAKSIIPSNGEPDFKYEAFKATNRKPSVDRAQLRRHPSHALLSATDGIVSLIAGQVRAIKSVPKPVGEEDVYAVDVVYAPTMENHAHSEIIVKPEYFGSNKERRYAYRMLRIALALLANESGWTLRPLA